MKLKIIATAAVLLAIGSACTTDEPATYFQEVLATTQENQTTAKENPAKALDRVAVGYAKAGQKDKAEQLLAQAIQYSDRFQGLLEIALKYAQVGQKDKAEQLLNRALEFAGGDCHEVRRVRTKG